MKPIGVFDSGYGGLTVFKEIVKQLPQYDFVYLGDNARAPYGTRDFETVYKYTLQSVNWFFNQNCPLVILACNTASAKALRTIQQNDLPKRNDNSRVLGVIRPTAEVIGGYSKSGHVGVFATSGTVRSESYEIEIGNFFKDIKVTQEACPMWVPLIEQHEHNTAGSEFFIKKNVDSLMEKDPDIDTVLLGCTHYPLIEGAIKKYLPEGVTILSQGEIIAKSLVSYLKRHEEIDYQCTKNSVKQFYTTGDKVDFDTNGSIFFGETINSKKISLD